MDLQSDCSQSNSFFTVEISGSVRFDVAGFSDDTFPQDADDGGGDKVNIDCPNSKFSHNGKGGAVATAGSLALTLCGLMATTLIV